MKLEGIKNTCAAGFLKELDLPYEQDAWLARLQELMLHAKEKGYNYWENPQMEEEAAKKKPHSFPGWGIMLAVTSPSQTKKLGPALKHLGFTMFMDCNNPVYKNMGGNHHAQLWGINLADLNETAVKALTLPKGIINSRDY